MKEPKNKLIITKKLKGDDGHKTFSIRIKDETVERLDDIARKTNRSRNDLINMKTNRYTIRVIIYVLCGVAIITSFFNVIMFYVILGILLIALITYVGTYIYFSKKYWQNLSFTL